MKHQLHQQIILRLHRKSCAMFLTHQSQLADRNCSAAEPETSSWSPSLSSEVLHKWGKSIYVRRSIFFAPAMYEEKEVVKFAAK